MRFTKPALSFEQQLDLLIARGLLVPERNRALRWLKRVSYYRLSAYFIPFRIKGSDDFIPGTTIDRVISLYNFDCRLRLLASQAIERIEVAVRTSVTYKIAMTYGCFGHIDQRNFAPTLNHTKFLQELVDEEERSAEEFAEAYRFKYDEEEHLPVWMATELVSFGTLSLLYKNMRPDLQREIASYFGVAGDVFKNWLHSLSYIRNICAHHKRLWNRELAIRPMIPRKWPYACPSNTRVYSVLMIMSSLMSAVAPKSRWKDRIINLVLDSDVNLFLMGFPADWIQSPPWSASRVD